MVRDRNLSSEGNFKPWRWAFFLFCASHRKSNLFFCSPIGTWTLQRHLERARIFLVKEEMHQPRVLTIAKRNDAWVLTIVKMSDVTDGEIEIYPFPYHTYTSFKCGTSSPNLNGQTWYIYEHIEINYITKSNRLII